MYTRWMKARSDSISHTVYPVQQLATGNVLAAAPDRDAVSPALKDIAIYKLGCDVKGCPSRLSPVGACVGVLYGKFLRHAARWTNPPLLSA
jgi:hypothetical protein